MQIIESHRLMGQPRVAECTIDGIIAFQNLTVSGVEGQSVDDFGAIQEDAVELIRIVGDEGGIDGQGRGGRCFFRGNGVLSRILRKS